MSRLHPSPPDISIIVPCRNHGHLLGEALDSIAVQGIPGVEVIVVDDHSTDDTVSVAREWGAHVVRSHGQGAGAARNTGMAVAKGGILGFLDADDLWPPNSLQLRLSALDGYDACFGAVEEFIDPNFEDTSSVARTFGPTQMAGTLLITRATWDIVGPLNESLVVGEFIDWVARFDSASLNCVWVENVVLRRRIHATNTTRGSRQHTAANFLEIARLHRYRLKP